MSTIVPFDANRTSARQSRKRKSRPRGLGVAIAAPGVPFATAYLGGNVATPLPLDAFFDSRFSINDLGQALRQSRGVSLMDLLDEDHNNPTPPGAA